jgi:hypothetical protein
MTNAEKLAIALREFWVKGSITNFVTAVNGLKADGYTDEEINLISSDIAQALFGKGNK